MRNFMLYVLKQLIKEVIFFTLKKFFDLDMTIDGICKYKFHGKRGNYPLFIVLMSDVSGNISQLFFAVQFYQNFSLRLYSKNLTVIFKNDESRSK